MPQTHDIHIGVPRRPASAPRRTFDATMVARVLPRAMEQAMGDALGGPMAKLQAAVDDLARTTSRPPAPRRWTRSSGAAV